MIVARAGDADAQQILILVHGLDHRRQEQQELRVLHRRRARIEQVFAPVGGNRPVVVLARSVHALERLFMQQADQPVAVGDLLHHLHRELVVVGGDVRGRKDRRHLVLAGRDLVVLRLGVYAQLPKLLVQIGHERLDARADRAKVVILQLLPLRAPRAQKRAAGENQVGALLIIFLVDQEILLLGANGRRHAADPLAKERQHAAGLLADGLHRAQQRRFLIQNLARVRAERRRDAERVILDERIARRVPRGIAARLERRAQAARGEGRRIRLAPHQLLAGKLHDDRAIRAGRNEGIMLFCGDARHRLEPMGEVGRALLDGPVLHGVGHHARDLRVQCRALPHGLLERFIHVLGQSLLHNGLVKDHASKQLGHFLHCNLSHLRRCAALLWRTAFLPVRALERASV